MRRPVQAISTIIFLITIWWLKRKTTYLLEWTEFEMFAGFCGSHCGWTISWNMFNNFNKCSTRPDTFFLNDVKFSSWSGEITTTYSPSSSFSVSVRQVSVAFVSTNSTNVALSPTWPLHYVYIWSDKGHRWSPGWWDGLVTHWVFFSFFCYPLWPCPLRVVSNFVRSEVSNPWTKYDQIILKLRSGDLWDKKH